MSLVVLIDDERSFYPSIEKDLGDRLVVLRSSAEATQWLSENNQRVYQLFLDHDLGHTDGNNDTIMPVVDYICENPQNIFQILVHTQNPVGAVNIMRALEGHYKNVIRIEDVTDYMWIGV